MNAIPADELMTAAPNPLDEDNHADRIDRDGDQWRWCDECDGFRMGARHKPGIGWNAVEIDERYGPLTFAPRPADAPTTAPQPEPTHDHGDTSSGQLPRLIVLSRHDPDVKWSLRPDFAEELKETAWRRCVETAHSSGMIGDDDRARLLASSPYRQEKP